MEKCVFCHLDLEPDQQVILENEHCLFLQLKPSSQERLQGAGVIVPKRHKETVFDLSQEEWAAIRLSFKILLILVVWIV